MITSKKLSNLSKDFIDKLAGFTAGHLSGRDFERLIKVFETEAAQRYFTHSSESNLFQGCQEPLPDRIKLLPPNH